GGTREPRLQAWVNVAPYAPSPERATKRRAGWIALSGLGAWGAPSHPGLQPGLPCAAPSGLRYRLGLLGQTSKRSSRWATVESRKWRRAGIHGIMRITSFSKR